MYFENKYKDNQLEERGRDIKIRKKISWKHFTADWEFKIEFRF